MAKRKQEQDPEELPDASEKRAQNDDDDSGSDEVCAFLPLSLQCASLTEDTRTWTR
jgi:hypothetical protein